LTVPKDEVIRDYRELLDEYVKNVQIPGFRRGKVPREVLERKFGEALKSEAAGRILEKAIEEAFTDESFPAGDRPLAYSRPEVEGDIKPDFQSDLVFSLVYDVVPEVKIGTWQGLEVEVPKAAVTEEDIDRELLEIQERNSFVLDREEGAAAVAGDVATADYVDLDAKGKEIPETARKGIAFTVLADGSGSPAMEIVGMKKGETREITETSPNPAPAEGETAEPAAGKIRITLTELKEKRLPKLDDELAQDVDEKYNTLADLKAGIRKRLEGFLEENIKEMKVVALMEKIMETTPIVLPESMVQAEIGGRLNRLAQSFNMPPETVARMLAESQTGEELGSKWRPAAEKALRSRLIMEKLIEEKEVRAGDEEISAELQEMAKESGSSEEELRERYKDESLEYLAAHIKEKKFLDLLFAENTIKIGKKMSYLDVISNKR